MAGRRGIIAAASFVLSSSPASAHVKWFCGLVDLRRPPLAMHRVLSPFFLQIGAGFLGLMLLGSLADSAITRWGPALGSLVPRSQPLLIRLGVGLYCLSLWDKMSVAPWGVGRTSLTPELFSNFHLLGVWQFVVALLTVSRRTCRAAGIGLLGLYGLGIVEYGVFHMTDYVYFLGLAAVLMLDDGKEWAARALPLLRFSLSFSLMWTAIEKFLYPDWTILVLAAHPQIAAGLPPDRVTVIAGFVEFSLSFYLSVGRSLLRVGAAALMLVFLGAMPVFGMLDVTGHLPILAMLAVICLHGPTETPRLATRRWLVIDVAAIGGLALATIAIMFVLYEGMQRTTFVPLLAGTETADAETNGYQLI